MKRLDKLTDRYIVVSKSVRDALIHKYDIDNNKIEVVYNFLEQSEFNYTGNGETSIAVPPFDDKDAFIVGNVGAVSWRKGYDMFLAVAKNVKKMAPNSNIKFVWIGHIENEVAQRLNYDIRFAQLENQVFFIGQRPHPYAYYPLMDVFLLTSRDDPFPLSAMEAGYFKLPVLSFVNTGGIPEFLEKIDGVNFDYMDIQAVSSAIVALHEDGEQRMALGEAVRAKLFEELNIDKQLSKIIAILNSLSSKGV
jgi:glycosyltransferase involved in cell wall biosynthesis